MLQMWSLALLLSALLDPCYNSAFYNTLILPYVFTVAQTCMVCQNDHVFRPDEFLSFSFCICASSSWLKSSVACFVCTHLIKVSFKSRLISLPFSLPGVVPIYRVSFLNTQLQSSETFPLTTLAIVTVRWRSCGKVMFSVVFVRLSIWGPGSAPPFTY